MTLSFFVEKQKITRTDTERPATNSICYLKAKFEFGKDWNAKHNICPRFRAEFDDAVYVPALVNGRYLNDEGICFVPIEILQNPGRFLVSVTDETNGVRVTTSETYVTVVKGSSGMYSPTIKSLDLQYKNEDNLLQLTANGEAVGEGVEIPKQEIDDVMSDTSENPVQNKVAKAYTDEKTRATPTDITLTDNLLQLTANGETVGNGVELQTPPDGLQLDGNTLHLTENGVPVGTGAELPTVTVDSEMSETSENPVQNKAVFSAMSKKADEAKYFEYSVAFLGKAFEARLDSNGTFTYSLEFGYWGSDDRWVQMIASPCPKTSVDPKTDVLEILSFPVSNSIGIELSDGQETPTYIWMNLEDLSADLEVPLRVTIEKTINTGGYTSLRYVIKIDFSSLIATVPEEAAEITNLLTQINGIRIAWEDMPEPVVYE